MFPVRILKLVVAGFLIMNNVVMSNVLYCNPAQNDYLQLWFSDLKTGEVTEKIVESTQADTLLKSIVDIVREQPIHHIVVVNRARSFTFIRIVVTICNTLSYAMGATLHTVDQPVGEVKDLVPILDTQSRYIIPYYSQPPNIS